MKNRRPLLLFALAVTFGLGAAYLAQRSLDLQPTTIAEHKIETTNVVVTKLDLPMATALKTEHLDFIEWPTAYLPEGTFTDTSQLEGRVLRRPFAEGEAIRETGILPKDSAGGLEAIIEPNRRAVSVKVDPIVGVAGFVTPGSRVDVLATVRRLDWHNKQPYAKAVLQNVRVLAIDQKLEEIRGSEPELVSVVTLEVEPADAEKLTFMSHEGKLQLALRSPADGEEVKTRGVSVASLLGSKQNKKQAPRKYMQIVKGTQVSKKTF
jgi:pilus assembly protein CpaB